MITFYRRLMRLAYPGAGVHRFTIPSRIRNWQIRCRVDFDHLARVRAARRGDL